MLIFMFVFFFFKQKTAYEMRISDWSSDVCSSDLSDDRHRRDPGRLHVVDEADPAQPPRLNDDPADLHGQHAEEADQPERLAADVDRRLPGLGDEVGERRRAAWWLRLLRKIGRAHV